MNPYTGRLIDGFYIHESGYHTSHLINDTRGYYLHLHGSPLFYSDFEKDIINKDSYKTYTQNKNKEAYLREHIILCNTSLKLSRISSSPLLNSYWDFFKSALNKSQTLLLIGYSGNDPHINAKISKEFNGEKVFIIEYSGQPVSKKNRQKEWEEKIQLKKCNINENNLIWLDSILNYEFL